MTTIDSANLDYTDVDSAVVAAIKAISINDVPANRKRGGDIDAVTSGMGIERTQRRQLPVHRRLAAYRRHRRQHRHPPVTRLSRGTQPGHEPADIFQSH